MSLLKITIAALALIFLNIFVFLVPLVEITNCTQGSEDAWLLSFTLYMPLTIALALTALIGLPWARQLRWYTLPQFVVIPWAIGTSTKYLFAVTFKGNHLCSIATGANFNSFTSSFWAPYWAPVQLLVISLCCVVTYKFWSQASKAGNSQHEDLDNPDTREL